MEEASNLPEPPLLGSPVQIYRFALEHERFDKMNSSLVRAYWNLLQLKTLKNKVDRSDLSFSYTEKIHFDFGIWCGEQFYQDQEVLSFLEDHNSIEMGDPWPIIFDECIHDIENWRTEPPFHTITSWLEDREKHYQIYSETANFSIPTDVLKQMPASTGQFLGLREKRKAILKELMPFMLKAPGVNEKLVHLASGGALLDQIDFMEAKGRKSLAEQQKLSQLFQIWQELTSKIKTHFQHPKILSYLNKIEDLSQNIRKLIVTNRLNIDQAVKEAKSLYHEEAISHKRLARDILILKNNLNIGSVKSNRKPHMPMPSLWPNPIDPEHLKALRMKCLKLDRRASHSTLHLLAPGDFKGFYEFDRGTIVIPIYSSDPERSFSEAMADRLVILETLKTSSPFLEDLGALAFAQDKKLVPYFQNLYYRWINHGLNAPLDSISETELDFLCRHVAPPLEQLFLRDEETKMEKQQIVDMIHQLRLKKLSPKKYHMLAGELYAKGHLAEAAKRLNDLLLIYPERADISFALAHVYLKDGLKEKANSILNKWQGENNRGYYSHLLGLHKEAATH